MQEATIINASNVREYANEIKSIADTVNSLIGKDGGKINTDLANVYAAWQGQAADSYRAQVENAQKKFSDFYNTIVSFSNSINAAAQIAETTENKTTVM